MLKIKDNVDLKELEKYGFKRHTDLFSPRYNFYIYKISRSEHISISSINNILFFQATKCNSTKNLDIIYDLIQDGLVEKVEG